LHEVQSSQIKISRVTHRGEGNNLIALSFGEETLLQTATESPVRTYTKRSSMKQQILQVICDEMELDAVVQ
jgi:hypothetical protein